MVNYFHQTPTAATVNTVHIKQSTYFSSDSTLCCCWDCCAASTAAAGHPGEALDLYYKERGYPQVASLRAKLANTRCLVGGKLVLGSEHWLSEADREVLKGSPIRREVAEAIPGTDRMRRQGLTGFQRSVSV